MKIFLCGGGSGIQIVQAIREYADLIDKQKPILYIPLAMDSNKYANCYNWFQEEIKNVELRNFEMIGSSYELSKKDLIEYSSLYIGGGNIYKLMYELRQYNYFEKIKEYIKNDGIIFWGSARAIVCGNNINCCKMEDKEETIINNKNGFNILNNFSILCHLNQANLKKNMEYLLEYSYKYKVVYLPEEDVIYINNGSIKLIGDKEYIVYNNGKMKYGNKQQFEKDIKYDSI